MHEKTKSHLHVSAVLVAGITEWRRAEAGKVLGTGSEVPAPKTALDGVSDQLERALNQLDSIGNLDTVSPSIRLPEGVQLTVVVAKKLDELLTRLNGVHDGLMCDWLLPKLTYKYAKAFSDPHLAAMFLGTSNEAALVGFLEDVFKSMQ
ncbi:hypothetical protein HDU99_009063 [Rhizoclosmatium hyalinum]|nr:hypothetical protein HDU99_009063 [Rhizoclosmatium hyalinum]